MRIAFCGTPDFALPALSALIEAGHELMVFTQPDRPKGRHGTLTPPPVKELAQKHGIPVFQCEKIRRTEGLEALTEFEPDLMVTAAFGQILSAKNLAVPKYGCINIHASLLPKYRGAAPVQWAVVNGEKRTGVTTMMTDVGLDTGDILMVRETDILPDETSGELLERLAYVGAELLLDTIAEIENGTLVRTPQDETEATHCSMIEKEHARIDFTKQAQSIHDLVRGMNPWPIAYCESDLGTVKVYSTRMTDMALSGEPGEILIADPKKGLFVMCGDRPIEICRLQLPSCKCMDAKCVLMGKKLAGKLW